MSVHRSHDAQEQDKEGVVAELKHRPTCIEAGDFHHPSGNGGVGRGVRPKSLVGAG